MRRATALGLAAGAGLAAVAGYVRIREARRLERLWRSLEHGASPGPFTEELLDGLPDAARRYLLHAIEPGTPLAYAARLRMAGEIRTNPDGPWLPFTARQILNAERGFVWRVQAWLGPLALAGADEYADGRGQVRIDLFGAMPVVIGRGPDVSRSALGRLLGEAVLCPSALLPQGGAAWEELPDGRIAVTRTVDGETAPLELTVDDEGRLLQVSLPRWSTGERTEDGRPGYVPFGVACDGERSFGGYTIPERIRAAWWPETHRADEFFRAAIDHAEFLAAVP